MSLQQQPLILSGLDMQSFRLLQTNAVRLCWNAMGTALLAITASDVDVTNQSYYGEQKIHYLAADGTNDCLVPSLKVHTFSTSSRLDAMQSAKLVWFGVSITTIMLLL